MMSIRGTRMHRPMSTPVPAAASTAHRNVAPTVASIAL
jgi:hypothetical protein